MFPARHARNAHPFFSARIFFFLIAITVSLAGHVFAGQAVLTWSAPATFTDGTPITNLAGYKVYMGTEPGSYSQNFDVGNVTSYTVSGLNDGTTYYFAVTAYDVSGDVSGFSNQAIKTFPARYTLTASAGPGGNINPPSMTLTSGESSTFYITPSNGYRIADISIDGVSVGAVSTYTFSNVAKNHSISAAFTAEALVEMVDNIKGTFPHLQDSYDAVPAGTVATILVQATDFNENLQLDRDVAFTLHGGYAPGFSVTQGLSNLNGTLSVVRGALIADNLTIL